VIMTTTDHYDVVIIGSGAGGADLDNHGDVLDSLTVTPQTDSSTNCSVSSALKRRAAVWQPGRRIHGDRKIIAVHSLTYEEPAKSAPGRAGIRPAASRRKDGDLSGHWVAGAWLVVLRAWSKRPPCACTLGFRIPAGDP
jgi:hypothetical protein